MFEVKVEIYTQYEGGEIELEEEYRDGFITEQEARIEIENYINDVAWYGSYVRAYINDKLVKAITIKI